MKILYLDCGMGAAGDMLTGALVSLFSKEEQESFISKINSIGIDGVKVSLKDDVKCGITGKHVSVIIDGEEEHSCDVHGHGHEHHGEAVHEHTHGHDEHAHHHEAAYEHNHEREHHDEHEHHHEVGHAHHHTSLADIEHMISQLDVSDKVKNDVISVYRIIAEAESLVHGRAVSLVHFHEVGMKDALTDIVSVACLMEKIAADRVIISPVNVGFGKVKCAHGILPVPAPATAEILKGIPSYAGRFEGEMCTPTGAALIKYYADKFSVQPMMNIEDIGYGTGNKEFEAANVVKAVTGTEVLDSGTVSSADRIIELCCNVDDMTGEEMAYAVDVLLENGVRDAFVTPVIMKKGRSGMLLTVLCDETDREKVATLIFKHTTTIGIREKLMERMVLRRKLTTVNTPLGDVRVKVSEGYSVKRTKAEYEDLKRIAENTGMSISEVRKAVDDAIHNS